MRIPQKSRAFNRKEISENCVFKNCVEIQRSQKKSIETNGNYRIPEDSIETKKNKTSS